MKMFLMAVDSTGGRLYCYIIAQSPEQARELACKDDGIWAKAEFIERGLHENEMIGCKRFHFVKNVCCGECGRGFD